eukprot:1157979-Pelagomonas_calceolata.AAC.5
MGNALRPPCMMQRKHKGTQCTEAALHGVCAHHPRHGAARGKAQQERAQHLHVEGKIDDAQGPPCQIQCMLPGARCTQATLHGTSVLQTHPGARCIQATLHGTRKANTSRCTVHTDNLAWISIIFHAFVCASLRSEGFNTFTHFKKFSGLTH